MVGSHIVSRRSLARRVGSGAGMLRRVLLFASLFAAAPGTGVPRAHAAAPTFSIGTPTMVIPGNSSAPLMRARSGFTNASVDGTDNTIFHFVFTVTPPSNQTVNGFRLELWRNGGLGTVLDLYTQSNRSVWPIGYKIVGPIGSATTYNVYIAGWMLRGAFTQPWNDFGTRTVTNIVGNTITFSGGPVVANKYANHGAVTWTDPGPPSTERAARITGNTATTLTLQDTTGLGIGSTFSVRSDFKRDDRVVFWDIWPDDCQIRLWGSSTDTNAPTSAYSGYSSTVRVGPSGREVLVPMDANGNPDIYRADGNNRGGLTVTPVDGANDDDGTSSCTYTFRVRYMHPEGLPPRVAYNELSLPHRDRWRFPAQPDTTLPAGVSPSQYSAGVTLCMDTDAVIDGRRSVTDVGEGWTAGDVAAIRNPWYDPAHVLGVYAGGSNFQSPLMHHMAIDQQFHPGKNLGNITAEDCRNGIIFKYVITPTNHEVAVGVPANMFNGTVFGAGGISTSLISMFGQALNFIGIRYVDGDYVFNQDDNRRTRPDTDGYDPGAAGGVDGAPDRTSRQHTAPFLSLSAGPHAFTYRCTSDPTQGTDTNIGFRIAQRDTFGNIVQDVYRFPDYNAPAYDAGMNRPAQVFPEASTAPDAPANYQPAGWNWMQFARPFVNPVLDTDVATLPDSIANYPVRIATPVTVPNPLRPGATAPTTLLINATRALSSETLRFKVYYTQSENVSPVVKLVTLYQKQADGSFTFFATKSLEEEPQGAYSTGKALYYDWQLPPGQYRYYFRVSDGVRTAEWPGDSQAGTSLTMDLDTSHLANTVVVNSAPVLSSPSVSPGFGNTGSGFLYDVTYADADGDAPRYAYLLIGTHRDTVSASATAAGKTTLTLNDATVVPYLDNTYAGGVPYGEIAVIARPGGTLPAALQAATFRIDSNNTTQFVVDDPAGILNANVLPNDVIEIRRRVQMLPVGTVDYVNGTQYQFNTSTDSTIRLEEGTRSYHFEFTDNWGTPSDPEVGETTRWYNGVNNEIQGPVIQSNRAPSLANGKVTQPTDVTPPITGTSATQFKYQVQYTDPDNNGPTEMLLIIDPAEQDAAGVLYTATTVGTRTISAAGPGWAINRWAGKVLKLESGAVSGRYYVIASNTADTLTLVPGTDLVTDGVVGGLTPDTFRIIDVTGDIKAMTKSNSADNLYSDGCDYEMTTRLAVGQHTFLFRASDGYTTLYHSSTATPYTPINEPLVNVNTAPRLQLADVYHDGSATTVTAWDANSITVSGLPAALTANEWANRVPPLVPYAVEVLIGTGAQAVVRETFEITGNDATAGGVTKLYVRGNPAGVPLVAGDGFRIAPYPLDRVVAIQGTTFTWKIAYWDVEGDSPEGTAPAMMRLIVDNDPTWSAANIVRTREDATDQNYADGVTYLFTTNALTSGTHSFYFEANDGANAVRLPASGQLLGPAINNPPTLTSGTVAPTAGSRTNMYTFRVTYQDADNDPPDLDTDGNAPDLSWPRLIVRDPSGNILPDSTNLDPGNSNKPADYFIMRPETTGSYVNGIIYRYDLQNVAGLTAGKYTYTFEVRSTVAERPQTVILGPTDGPYINGTPRLSEAAVTPTTSVGSRGPRTVQYIYRVKYEDDQNHPPATDQPMLTIKRENGTVLQTAAMTLATTGNDGDYTNGEYYEYTTPVGFFTSPEAYSFTVDAVDAPGTNYTALTAAQKSSTGPYIDDVPQLSNLAVSPTVGAVNSSFTFSARYTHPDNAPPVATGGEKLLLFVYKPDGTPMSAAGVEMSTTDTTAYNSAGRLFTKSLTLSERGTYRFYVSAYDGGDTIISPAGSDTASANAISGPIVAGPATLGTPAVNPPTGYRGTTDFTFSITYTQAEGQAPPLDWPKVYVQYPDGSNGTVGNIMTTTNTAPDFTGGVVYSKAVKLPQGGTHKYRFEVPDGQGGYVRWPGLDAQGNPDWLTGPIVTNNPPTLTADTVTPTSGRTRDSFVFSVTYTDADDDPPTGTAGGKPILYLDGQAIDSTLITTVETPLVYTDGVVFTYTAQGSPNATALAPGTHTYKWVSSDGTNTVETTEKSVSVNRFPVLASPTVNNQASATAATMAANQTGPMRIDPGTGATFRVRYSDADGQVPSSIRVFMHRHTRSDGTDGAGALVSAYDMVAQGATDPASIQSGVTYAYTATGLAVGVYEYYFEASDGLDSDRLNDTADATRSERFSDLVVNSVPQVTEATVTPGSGFASNRPSGVPFKWSVKYADADGHAPSTAALTPSGQASRVRVFVYQPGQTAAVWQGNADAGRESGNVLTGEVYSLTSPIDEASGAELGNWAWYVKFSDGLQTIVRPQGADTDRALAWQGPRIYQNQAGLSSAQISALNTADPTQSRVVYPQQAPVEVALPTERVRYSVVYTNTGNNPPSFVRLFLDGATTPVAMTDSGTNQADPDRWAKGVVYTYTTPQPHSSGSHSFVMQSYDGTDYHYVGSGTVIAPVDPTNPNDPPRVDLTKKDNVAAPPVQTLANPRVTPSGGGVGATYEFAVNFNSFQSATAGYLDQDCTAWADVTQPTGAVLNVPLTRAGTPATGITFKASPQLTEKGDHSFRIFLNDKQFVYSTNAIAQPKVAVPELANPVVSPTKGILERNFEFSVNYRHGGQQPAYAVTLFLYDSNNQKVSDQGYAMKTSESNTALLPSTGWTYRVSVPISTAGSYSFRIEATDVDPLLGVSAPVSAPATGTVSGPEVTPPVLSAPAVSPVTGGYAGGIFTFSVKYTFGANRPPAFVRLRLTKPDGMAADPVELVPAADGDYVNGKVYSKSIALIEVGDYSFFFEAGDKDAAGNLTVTSTSAATTGLSVTKPTAPVLESAKVEAATTGGNRFTYTVVYKQSQKLSPAWVRLYIDYQADTGQAARVVDMTRLDASTTAYDTGVVYTYTTPETLAPGQHNFRITASNGFEETETPVTAGPLINIEPTLEAKKVSPERGDENTTFTFEALYKDADNQAAEFVKISVGNKAYTLQQVDATDTNYVDGALYRAQIQLPAGDLSHSFQASDGIATVRAPANGVVAGPKVLPKTNITLSVNRAALTLDAQTGVAVSGTLAPAVSNAPVKVTFNVLLPQEDGSTVEETRVTVEVQADSDGKFSASAVPDQDGSWNIRAEYAGDVAQGGTNGSGKALSTFTVDPARHVLMPAVHMLGLPTTPAAGDLRKIITGGDFQTAHYTGNKDMPYLYGPDLPFPTPRPGSGFWLRGGANLQVSASGRLVDHSKEHAIPVRPGWQIISNPYLIPTDWQAAQFKTAGQRVPLMQAGEWVKTYAWTWDAARSDFRLLHGAYNGFFAQTDRDLQAWQGAWFYSRVEGELILAAPTGSRAGADEQRAARARHRSTEREWSIQLRATNGRESDGFNYAGVTSQGRGATHSSMASPPVLPGYVDLYFQGPDAGSRYATDFRAPVAGEQAWDFTVETDVLDRPVTISALDLSRLPKTLEVLLEDVDAGGKRTYMRTSGGYTFNPGEGGKRQMRLIIRPRAEGALRVVQVDVSPTRGGRSFNVTLSQDAMVSVEILSPSGQQLAVVADSKPTVDSRATLFWDETRKDGARLPAGVYLAKVTAKLPEGQVTQSVRPLVLAR